MSNKADSRRHGLVGHKFPKAKPRKKRNKAKLRLNKLNRAKSK